MVKPILKSMMIIGCFAPIITMADQSVSKTYLARVNTMIDKIYPLIEEAKANDSGTSRDHFNYKALQSDVLKIQTGIANYINQVQVEPNTLEPLRGEYEGLRN